MYLTKTLAFLFLSILLSQSVSSQKLYRPINLPISLAGNYGELRRDHFHMGLDFKTNKEENYRVYAAEDGYVSRIKISRSGYGKCLYITHPNLGITTVYGHLNSFETPIQAKINGIQENRRQNEVDVNFNPKELPVKRGDVVAFSGNTGGSTGPHLHFEVRNMNSELAYNPLNYIEEVDDHKAPIFSKVLLYYMRPSGSIYYKSLDVSSLEGKTIPVSHHQIGVAISTYDQMDNAPNKVSFYESIMDVNDEEYYKFRFDSLDFDWDRQVLAISDYNRSENDVYKLFYEKCGFDLGNLDAQNNGIINFHDGEKKDVRIVVRDYEGNKKDVNFSLSYSSKSTNSDPETNLMDCDVNNKLESKHFVVIMEPNTTVASYVNNFKETTPDATSVASFELFDGNTGAVRPFKVRYNTDNPSRHKMYLELKVGKKTRRFSPKHVGDNHMMFEGIESFGIFNIKMDTIVPNIQSNYTQDAYQLIFKATDNESDIDTYDLYIDEVWRIAYYDQKTDRIIYNIFPRDRDKTSNVKLVVKDNLRNQSTRNFKIKF